ncbi:MAG TPA: 30S ribosomal protein S18 [Clostridia bacterium]|nr:30S ribosomal protein S18 [Clostridia bacterium]
MKRKSFKRKLRPVVQNCPFCKQGIVPSYKDVGALSKYLTERGKILSKERSGLCAKHQRRIATQIKRARFLALLPFVVRVK